MAHLSEGVISSWIIRNFSVWGICPFFPIHWFNHLFVSVWTQGYLFYTFGYNPIPLLFCWLNCLPFGGWEHFELALMFLWHTLLVLFFGVISLLSGTEKCSRFILQIPCPKHFSKESWFPSQRTVLKAMIWALGMKVTIFTFCILYLRKLKFRTIK